MKHPAMAANRRPYHLAYLLSLLTLLTGCGTRPPPSLPALAPQATIVALGDSLTAGNGASRQDSYPAVLARLTGRQVISEGVPGDTSAGALQRLPGILSSRRPDLVVLCIGGNDFLRRGDPAKTKANIRRMVEMMRERQGSVVLVGVPRAGLFLDTADLYREVAEEFQIPLEAESLPELLSEPDMKSDQIHLNKAGYARLAEAIHHLLVEAGAV